ncbi:hypothetical protein BGZ83_001388 [Gryganskiella cystojenkinii]|nr:hypothetical protein BGZ83_001388 [Gryganskiella cystojenkinii]
MVLFKKQPPVLFSLVLFAAAGLQVYAAPVGSDMQYHYDETVAPPGPLISNWRFKHIFTPEGRDQERQQRRLAFRQFTEKHVSEDCAPILSSTLVQLNIVQDFVHGRLKTKTSYEFFEPVLRPLVVLDMGMNRTFPVEYVPKVEKVDTSSSAAQVKFGYIKDESDEYYIIGKAPWTEENEPKSLFKYRFRVLEKNLGVFLHVVKALPEPVRQELDSAGFLHDAQSLRTLARSLLTCEGVRHVTYEELKEKVIDQESYENDKSDQYIEMSEILETIRFHHNLYRERIMFAHLMAMMAKSTLPMDPAQAACGGLGNVTKNDSPPAAVELSLEEQAIDPSSPLRTFVWSNEDMLRMVKAASSGSNNFGRNEELLVLLFQD